MSDGIRPIRLSDDAWEALVRSHAALAGVDAAIANLVALRIQAVAQITARHEALRLPLNVTLIRDHMTGHVIATPSAVGADEPGAAQHVIRAYAALNHPPRGA